MDGTENLKPLDAFEAELWRKYKKKGIKFKVSETFYNPLAKALDRGTNVYGGSRSNRDYYISKETGMHHYEIDGFYDEWAGAYGNVGFADMYGMIDVEDMSTSIKEEKGESYRPDILEALDALEEQGRGILMELSDFSKKSTLFFEDAKKQAAEAERILNDMNVLAGSAAKSKVNVLKDLTAKFDEKLAAMRFKLAENKVNGLIERFEDKHREMLSEVKGLLKEIEKLA